MHITIQSIASTNDYFLLSINLHISFELIYLVTKSKTFFI